MPLAEALRGRRVLVVEDEYLLATEMQEVLHDAGANVLGPVSNVAAALRIVQEEGSIDAAVLDVEVRDGTTWPVVDALRARRVPVLLSTGYAEGTIPNEHASLPRLGKPVTGQQVVAALEAILAGALERS